MAHTAHSDRRTVAVGRPLTRALDIILRMRRFRTIMLEGPTGIGKSEFVKQFAFERGLRVVVLDLAAMDPPDLSGLPQILDGRTRFASPSWLPTDGRGILFLDELNRAPLEVQQALYRLVLEGRLHEYELPPGWIVWAAINPAEDGDYQVTELDPALSDRFRKLTVVASRDEWLRWARDSGIHPAVLAVVRAHTDVFDTVSPRAWERTSDTLTVLEDDELADEEMVRDLCTSDLGDVWMQTLLNVVRNMGPEAIVDGRVLLARYAEEDPLREMLVAYHEQGRTDRLAGLTERVAKVLEGVELREMIAGGEFDLQRFELLLSDLHGDYARRLQLALGNNADAIVLAGVDADIDLARYEKSELGARMREWEGDPLLEHLRLLAATAVAVQIESHPEAGRLRRRRSARRSLGTLLRQAGPTRAVRLADTLQRLRIDVDAGAGGAAS